MHQGFDLVPGAPREPVGPAAVERAIDEAQKRRERQQVERDDAKPELILTVRSVGYRFNPGALG